MPAPQKLDPFAGWIYLCSTRKRRWAKTSVDNRELCICKNSHPQSQQLGSFWLPQCVVRDTQQEHQQPFCFAIECADGVSDVLVADDAEAFLAAMRAIKIRGEVFYSVPSGGYVYHRHTIMVKDDWTLCWAVIEDQFLTLWKNKSLFDAAASSSTIGGMGGDVQPLLVLPLMCATVIQCTDNVTASIDLHQEGRVVATHFLYLGTSASCAAWMEGFLKAVGIESVSGAPGANSLAVPTITTLDLHFPKPHELVKTPEPGGMTLPPGAKVIPKAPKVLPDIVYGSAEQLAATSVPPLPDNDKVSWTPLPDSELSKISAALGNPLEAIGTRISASLSWLKDKTRSFEPNRAAADVSTPDNPAAASSAPPRAPSAGGTASRSASSSEPESLSSTQRSGPTSQSLQSAQSIRHRQPAVVAENGAKTAADAQPEDEAAQALLSDPPPEDKGGGLMSSLPLPEWMSCSRPR